MGPYGGRRPTKWGSGGEAPRKGALGPYWALFGHCSAINRKLDGEAIRQDYEKKLEQADKGKQKKCCVVM